MSSDGDNPMNPTSGLDSDGRSDSESDNDIKPSTTNQQSNQQQQNGSHITSVPTHPPSSSHPSTSASASAASSTYTAAVAARSAKLTTAPSAPPKSYSIQAQLTIPHSTQVNAFAAPPCFSHLYSGGADGFVRRHAMAALNSDRPGWDPRGRTNLYAKSSGGVEGRQGVLSGYWENEEPGGWVADTLANAGQPGSESRGESLQQSGKAASSLQLVRRAQPC